jgi:hypothetical protein
LGTDPAHRSANRAGEKMAYKIKAQKLLGLITSVVLTLAMNLGGAKLVLAAGSQPLVELQRPRVSEAEGWKKVSLSAFTVTPKVRDKEMWIRKEKKMIGYKVPSKVFVFRINEEGLAEIWADVNGVHFYDKKNGRSKTALDFSKLGFWIGPQGNYDILTDPSGSYFFVRWSEEIAGEPKRYIAFLDSSGTVLYKNINDKKISNGDCVATAWPLPNGKIFVVLYEGCDVEGEKYAELWDLRGKKKNEFPKGMKNFSFSDDFKRLHYDWRVNAREKRRLLKSEVFNIDGK